MAQQRAHWPLQTRYATMCEPPTETTKTGESVHHHRRPLALAAGLALAVVVVAVVVHARGGSAYELRFGTAFSDGEGLALIAAAAVAAGLLAGVRWAVALLVV